MFMDDYKEYFDRARITTQVHAIKLTAPRPFEKRFKENKLTKETSVGKPAILKESEEMTENSISAANKGILSNINNIQSKTGAEICQKPVAAGTKKRVKKKKKKWMKRI